MHLLLPGIGLLRVDRKLLRTLRHRLVLYITVSIYCAGCALTKGIFQTH